MKKIHLVATSLVVSLGLNLASFASPLWAGDPADQAVTPPMSTTAIAANTYTLEDIQKLALVKNRTSQLLATNLKILEENRMLISNNKHDINNQMNNLPSPSFDNTGLAALDMAIAKLNEAILADPDDSILQAQLISLQMQKSQMEASLGSAASSIESGFQSLLAARDQLSDQLDSLAHTKDDLEKTQKDWEKEINLVTQALFIKTSQLESTSQLLQKQYHLAQDLDQLEKIKNSLGLSTDLDLTGQTISVNDAANQYIQASSALASLKRQINDLTGRPLNAPLYLVAMDLPSQIHIAPAYTPALLDQVTKNNYQLKTLQRDLDDYKDQGKEATDSNQKAISDGNQELTNLSIADQKAAIENDLKAKLQQINSTGTAYRSAQLAYDKEQKNALIAQQKLNLGLISPLEYKSGDLALANAHLALDKAGANYHLAWQEYTALLNGTSLTAYNTIKNI